MNYPYPLGINKTLKTCRFHVSHILRSMDSVVEIDKPCFNDKFVDCSSLNADSLIKGYFRQHSSNPTDVYQIVKIYLSLKLTYYRISFLKCQSNWHMTVFNHTKIYSLFSLKDCKYKDTSKHCQNDTHVNSITSTSSSSNNNSNIKPQLKMNQSPLDVKYLFKVRNTDNHCFVSGHSFRIGIIGIENGYTVSYNPKFGESFVARFVSTSKEEMREKEILEKIEQCDKNLSFFDLQSVLYPNVPRFESMNYIKAYFCEFSTIIGDCYRPTAYSKGHFMEYEYNPRNKRSGSGGMRTSYNINEWIEMSISKNKNKNKTKEYCVQFNWNMDGWKKGEKIIEMDKRDLEIYHFYPAIASCCPCDYNYNYKTNAQDKGYGFEFCTISD